MKVNILMDKEGPKSASLEAIVEGEADGDCELGSLWECTNFDNPTNPPPPASDNIWIFFQGADNSYNMLNLEDGAAYGGDLKQARWAPLKGHMTVTGRGRLV